MTKTSNVFLVFGIALAGAMYSSVSAQAPTGVNDGIYTAAQAERGKAVFAMNCAACHGDKLEGGGSGPELSGPSFTGGYTSGTAAALYTKISQDMPSSAPGTLMPEQYADVLAFVLNVNKYPAGKTEIPKDGAGLKDVKMAAPPK
jgi:S-disulfanyl-L-cysteine oxidoreductase SoxD